MARKYSFLMNFLLSMARGFAGIGMASLLAAAIGFPSKLAEFWVICGQGAFFESAAAFFGIAAAAFLILFIYLFSADLCGRLADEIIDTVLPVKKNEWGEAVESSGP